MSTQLSPLGKAQARIADNPDLALDFATTAGIVVSRKIITNDETYIKNVSVLNVSLEQPDGKPWTYEGSGNRYGIVNLALMNMESASIAREFMLKARETGDDAYNTLAANTNLSASVPYADAVKLSKGMLVEVVGAPVTFKKPSIEDGSLSEDDTYEAVGVTRIIKQKASEAKKLSADFFAMEAPKEKTNASEEFGG